MNFRVAALAKACAWVGVGFFVVGLSACAGSSSSSTTTTTTTTPVTQSEISLPSSVQVVSAK